MTNFESFVFRNAYNKLSGRRDRLVLMSKMIDWSAFRPLVAGVFNDDKVKGGRPHTDEVLIVKSLVLQALYGLSDPELEYQVSDRLSFRNFLGYPERVPDFTTIWKIRERLKDVGVEEKIWLELQRQLDAKGYQVKKGVIQDACFIGSDLGRKRHYREKKAKKKGEKINYSKKQESHIDRDATFSIKHGQVHHGYKNHIKMDVAHQLIRAYEVTTASTHDGCIDLAKSDEVVYRDRGYQGKTTKALGNATMKRGKLTIREKLRNKRISKTRVIGERPFSVMKRVFNGGRTFVKNLSRVKIKEMFKNFSYNLYQLVTLTKQALAIALLKT